MEQASEDLAGTAAWQSYRPRAAEFSTSVVSSELGPQRNRSDETRVKISHQGFRQGQLIASISNVCYGTYSQKPAAFVALELNHTMKDLERFRKLEIEVSFRHQSHEKHDLFPVVRNLSPCRLYGVLDSDGRTWSYRVEKQSLVSARGSRISKDQESSKSAFPVAPSLSIEGLSWSEKRNQVQHQACWIVTDKGEPRIGIPNRISLAMVVEYAEAFQADVKISIPSISPVEKALALLWPKDDPILFPAKTKGQVVGAAMATTQFETLSDEDWARLFPDTSASVSLLPPHAEEARPPEKPQKAEQTFITYRVHGLPSSASFDSVADSLIRELGARERNYKPKVRSVACHIERAEEKIATFRLPSSVLSGTGPMGLASPIFSIDSHFQHFTPLADPVGQPHLVDVIALTGLGGHAWGSFREKGGDNMWLLDQLPSDLPYARVMTYGYNTKLENSVSIQDLEAIAGNFRIALKTINGRPSEGASDHRPIIFVAHSLGGIVLKETLIQMADGNDEDHAILSAIRGILFFGVPSQGMDISSLVSIVQGRVNEPFLQALRPDSSVLRQQHRLFCEKFPHRTCKIVSLYETELSPTACKGPTGWKMDGEPALLVGPNSATSGSRPWEVGPNYTHAIPRNHSEMVKFHTYDPCYSNVRWLLQDLCKTMHGKPKA